MSSEGQKAKSLLRAVVHEGAVLPANDAGALMQALLRGDFADVDLTALLTALHVRGVTAAELAGFARAMRNAAVPLPLSDAERDEVVDTCGTGGDGSGTFNISTGAALVAAAAGAKVAKHGNRSVTSRCGSADVLEALGVPIDLEPAAAAEALRRHGFVFLLATRMHPAMRNVVAVRRALPFRTVFNLLGPMTNPAGALRQLMGVYSVEAVPLVAAGFAALGNMRAVTVVHGQGVSGGMDEFSIAGRSEVAHIVGADWSVQESYPQDAGLTPSNDALQGGDAVENAAILHRMFSGECGAARDVVLLNAAAVLQVASVVPTLQKGVEAAAQAIDAGAVLRLLHSLQRT